MGGEQWYTNKDLFEQIMGLRSELEETRSMIKEYNGLREEVHNIEKRFIEHEAVGKGKSKVAQGIKEWGGWIVAIVALAVNIIKLF